MNELHGSNKTRLCNSEVTVRVTPCSKTNRAYVDFLPVVLKDKKKKKVRTKIKPQLGFKIMKAGYALDKLLLFGYRSLIKNKTQTS